ncbi:MAG: serine acetyltransferase [Moritella sp.]|uniref:serine acetyltransferase n=1 Tax=Moritella sp. TaxID=78556 RepID=UPI0025E76BC2|nr:serine acetyltransferase [Moritella sp.]NQZ93764.1 serine acetyltransferase [Moritella sp.]
MSYIFSYIKQDIDSNPAKKSKFILIWFRSCQLIVGIKKKYCRILLMPIVWVYRIVIDWVMGIDLPPETRIGKGLALYHGQGLVIGKGTVIGESCTLRHGVTIGRKLDHTGRPSRDPHIGNNVEFGAYSILIGDIAIGDNCVIGAGTVVSKSLLANTVVVSEKFRCLSGGINSES